MPISGHGACRLCWHQAQISTAKTDAINIAEANRFGQQLFLANVHSLHQRRVSETVEKPHWHRKNRPSVSPAPFTPVRHRQLVLFTATPDLTRVTDLPTAAPLPAMSDYLDEVLRDHTERYGWSARVTNTIRQSLQVLQHWQDTPGAPISAAEAEALLRQRGLTLELTLQVLTAAGLLDDDRDPALRAYFERAATGLPNTMRRQFETWYRIMTEGSASPPRRRPRAERTTRWQIYGIAPCLRSWAARGVDSLTEVTVEDVITVLPDRGVPRLQAGGGLRSLFSILKGRREVFTNPAARVDIGKKGPGLPLPLDVDTIRSALDDPKPVRAFAVALAAFHGLAGRQIHQIKLSDIVDGRLRIGERAIPLAQPVRVRLTAYLDDRERRFPATNNPYLLVNRKNATRTTPVSPRYPWHRYTINSKQLREDRILNEMFATGGDVRRICDLFGISVTAACRYSAALEHPELRDDQM